MEAGEASTVTVSAPYCFHIRFALEGKLYDWWMRVASGPDTDMLKYFELGKLPEAGVFTIMHRALRAGDTAIDGGANNGMFSLFMSQCVGPGGKIIAFEPDPWNLECLRANLAINNITNVEVREQALWSEIKELPFYRRECYGLSSLYEHVVECEAFEKIAVPSARLHDIEQPVRLIKLDVEGAELEALRGAGRHLRGCPYFVCEWNDIIAGDQGRNNYEVIVFMRSLGYSVFTLSDTAVDPLPDGQMPSGFGNVLFAYTGN